MNRLPNELISLIIDKLNDCCAYVEYPSTIRACCFVCRAWAPLAQCKIFQKVIVSDRTSSPFRKLLDGSPNICTYVRDISFLYLNPNYMYDALSLITPRLIHLRTCSMPSYTILSDPQIRSLSQRRDIFGSHGLSNLELTYTTAPTRLFARDQDRQQAAIIRNAFHRPSRLGRLEIGVLRLYRSREGPDHQHLIEFDALVKVIEAVATECDRVEIVARVKGVGDEKRPQLIRTVREKLRGLKGIARVEFELL